MAMQQMPELHTVYEALKCLYHDQNAASQERASSWLQSLQQSVFAWSIADQLLQHNVDMESSYFGAQTLRTKIQTSFLELPAEAHSSLRDSLIQHLKNTDEKTNSVVVKQLSLALADLMLQVSSWQNPIDYLLHTFVYEKNVAQTERHLWPLLELLTVIPEEIQDSRHLKLGANRRTEVKQILSNSSNNVLIFLESALQMHRVDPNMNRVRVLRCFKAWISAQVAPIDIWGRSSVFSFTFEVLKRIQLPVFLREVATDVLCTFLEEMYDCSDVPSHLSDLVVSRSKELIGAYTASVEEEDTGNALDYCRIFTHLCESQLYEIIGDNQEGQPKYLDLLDLLLVCCDHPEFEIAEITFLFWYKLSEEVYRRNQDSLNEVYRVYIERLLISLRRQSQMEPDQEEVLDKFDEFSDFRKRVTDLVKEVVFIVGSTSVFRQCAMSLHGASWECTEAGLFMMSAVARNLLPDENEAVPGVIQAILSLPPEAHICVRHTSIQLISEMGEWIDHHPEYLEPVLHFLINHLRDPRVTDVAATAIESVCSVARDRMTKHFDGLVQLVATLDSYPLEPEAAIKILKGVTSVLSRLPDEQIQRMMFELCRPQIDPLKNLVNQVTNPEKGKSTDPSFWLDRLAAIFRHLTVNTNGNSHPCQAVMIEIWPVFSAVAEKYQHDRRICERFCRCLRFGLRSLGRFSAPLIGSIVKQITDIYARHQHSCFLYLGSILVDEYAGDKSCTQGFLNMLEAFLGPAYALLEKQNGLRDNPDTVDDLFRLCTRLLQRYPSELLGSRVFQSLFQCALTSAMLDHRDACSSVMKFLSEVVHCAKAKSSSGHNDNDEDSQRIQLAQAIIQPHSATLVTTLLSGSIFHLSSCNTSDVAEVLYALASVDRENTRTLISHAFSTLPRTTASGCPTATEDQMHTFLEKTVKSTCSKEVSRALRDFIRLYR